MDLETVRLVLSRLVDRFQRMLHDATGGDWKGCDNGSATFKKRHMLEWYPDPSTNAEWWDIVQSGQLEACSIHYPDGYVYEGWKINDAAETQTTLHYEDDDDIMTDQEIEP